MYTYVYCSTNYNSQNMGKKKKNTHIYIHACIHTMGYYSATKRNEIFAFATTWMDREGITLSEISQRKAYTI